MSSPEPPWDDEDAMIAQDMDFEEEEEPPYDEAMLQEAEQQVAPVQSAGDTTRPPAAAVVTTTPVGAPEPMDNNACSSDDDADQVAVREEYQRKRPNPDSHFQFDRYRDNKTWRKEAVVSPTSKAKKWKAKESEASTQLHKSFAAKRNLCKVLAPDAQLVTLANKAHSKQNASGHKKIVTKLARFPTPGKSTCAMTLDDGSRVFVPVRGKSACRLQDRSRASSHALGISFKSLLHQVDLGRRQRERSKYRNPEKSPTSIAALHSVQDDQLWVDKHAPSCFSHLLSDERCNRGVIRALRAWDPAVFGRAAPKSVESSQDGEYDVSEKEARLKSSDKRPEECDRVILLSGPPGVGKSTLAHIIARHVGYRPIESNASDERSSSALKDCVARAMESTLSFEGKAKPNCLILDEVDGADSAATIQSVVDIIRAEVPKKGSKSKDIYLRRPIIFICNNRFAPSLKPLLPYAKHFAVNPPMEARLVSRLRDILESEKLSAIGGGSLMSQLVSSTNSDIRACLNTLQFAAFRARSETNSSGVVDVSDELKDVLGSGMKDHRCDLISLASAVFLKQKKSSKHNTDHFFSSCEAFGDNSKLLDCVFLNITNVPYVDPTLDRCSIAYDWLSQADVVGLRASSTIVASFPASIHVLCRVERRPELNFSTRIFGDAHYRKASNFTMLQRFAQGVSLGARSSRNASSMATDTIPFVISALASGEGSCALTRNATSVDLLSNGERKAFEHHSNILQSLGLAYVAEKGDAQGIPAHTKQVCLEPPIEQLVHFPGQDNIKQQIPTSLKELLSRKAAHNRLSKNKKTTIPVTTKQDPKVQPQESAPKSTATKAAVTQKRKAAAKEILPPSKKAKPQNFLLAGARKAKAAKSKRMAERVGVNRRTSNAPKMTNTGSGVPIDQVIRLKYVKGFTQAVRTPCRLKDL